MRDGEDKKLAIILEAEQEEYKVSQDGNKLIIADAVNGFFGRNYTFPFQSSTVLDGQTHLLFLSLLDNDIVFTFQTEDNEVQPLTETHPADILTYWASVSNMEGASVGYRVVDSYDDNSTIEIAKEPVEVLSEKTYLSVAFGDKERAKSAGVRWDKELKKWFAPALTPVDNIKEWFPAGVVVKTEKEKEKIELTADLVYLVVDYDTERDEAKRIGLKWNKENGLWYAPVGTSVQQIEKFLPDTKELNLARQIGLDPDTKDASDLQTAMSEIGLDGSAIGSSLHDTGNRWLRIPVLGKSTKNKSGAYKISMGNNGGYIVSFKNHVNGMSKSWFEKSFNKDTLTKSHESEYIKIGKARRAQKELDEYREHVRTAFVINNEFERATPADPLHPYLVRKQVDSYDLKQDWRGALMIPFRDIDGKLWSVQRIWETEESSGKIIGRSATKKEVEKGITYSAKKKGCMFLIGADHSTLERMNPIVLVEGFATGASIQKATNLPVLMTIDKDNLAEVADIIRAKYPEKILIIAGDNDIKRELEGKKNEGKEKALGIVEKLGLDLCYAMLPHFTDEEIKKEYSDWNDLAISRGLTAVRELFVSGFTQWKAVRNGLLKEREEDIVEKSLARNAIKREENRASGTNETNDEGRHP